MAKTKTRIKAKAKTSLLAFLTLALLLGVVWAVYYLYISDRESSFIDQNFRLLALWSDEISRTVDEYKYDFQYRISKSIDNEDASSEHGKKHSQQRSHPSHCEKNVSPEGLYKDCDCLKDTDTTFRKFKCRFEKEFKGLAKNFEGQLTLVSVSRKPKDLAPNQFVDNQPHIKAQVSPKDKDSLRLTYSEERKKYQSAETYNLFEIEVDLSISKIITPFINKLGFDNVIVFNSKTGKVHFQEDHFLLRIDNFYDIVAQRPDTEGGFPFFSNRSGTTDGQNGTEGFSPPSWEDLLQNPTHRQMTIGDISYELFTQPVVLPGLPPPKQTHDKHTNDVQTRLILAGLVETDKFQSEYRAIPHTWLLSLLFFVLLGLLALPIIHLGLMDPREPLGPTTILSILFTCVVGTAMIALLFLDVVWLNNVRHSLDNQLEITATEIKKKFGTRLEDTLVLLSKQDCSEEFEKDFTWVTTSQNNDADACATRDVCQRDCPEDAAGKPGVKFGDNPYDDTPSHYASGGKSNKDTWIARTNLDQWNNPCAKDSGKFCDLFFWVDSDKRFRITWTTKDTPYLQTSNVFLAHRDYVTRILDPDPKSSLWHVAIPLQEQDENENKKRHLPFYAQSLRSLQTGKHKVIVSMESSQHSESSDGKREKWVAAIRTDFQFLQSVAIPKGTGFAVIEDEGGKVLFHSDDRRSLWENFFEETDDNPRLKTHIFSRTPGTFEGTYWGKGHAFYSTPLPNVPWSLVVFRNKDLFRTTNFEALLLAGSLFAVYVLILGIIPAVIWLFNKVKLWKVSISWFWPDSGRPYCCHTAIVLIFFLVGIVLFGFIPSPPDSTVGLVFPYLLFSLICLWITTKFCAKRTPNTSSETLHWRYVFAVISLLLLFSALPMGIFFKAGVDREMALAMKYNLITLGDKLRRTPGLDFSQIQATGNGTETGSAEVFPFLERGIHLHVLADTDLVVPADPPAGKDPEPSLLDKFHRFIRENSLSRLSTPVSIETLGLLAKQPPDKSDRTFYWEDVSPSSLSLTFQTPLKQSGSKTNPEWTTLKTAPFPDTWFSIKDFPDKRHVVSFIVFIAGVLVIVLVPLFIVRRIFPILPPPSNNEGIGPPRSHEDIWQKLPTEQKVTLYNLAKDGFVHAENPDLVTLSQPDRSQPELIQFTPNPCLRDRGFEEYVLNAIEGDDLETLQQKSQSQWQVLKWPLVIVFVVLGLGLLLTQEEFGNVVVIMLSLLPVFLPMLSELTGGSQKAGKAN